VAPLGTTAIDNPSQGCGLIPGRIQRRHPASPPCLQRGRRGAAAQGNAAERSVTWGHSPDSEGPLQLGGEEAARLAERGSTQHRQHKQPHMGIVWIQGAPWPFLLSPDAIQLT